jgi:uncharacterized membrane protein YraQ (UPF0718 family)
MKNAGSFTLWSLIRSQWLLLLAVGLYLWGFASTPERAAAALRIAAIQLGSVVPLLLAVMGLVGLLQVWISRDLVARLLGREGGMRALLIAALCGTILIGPAYLIFPMLLAIQKQGARWAVIVIVLATYAVKLQMIPLEVGFLGWKFSALRIGLTLLLAIPLGLLVEWIVERPARGGKGEA